MTDSGAERGQQMSRAQYDSIDAVNWSKLRSMRVSPKQYRWDCDHGREDSAALRLGRAVHVAVFEPDRLKRDFVVYKGPTRRGKAWESFQEEHSGREILTWGELIQVEAIHDAVRGDPVASQYLDGGYAEQSFTWTDAETGLPCKCRVDLVHDALVELKTTRYITRSGFARDFASLGYHGQLAFYADGIAANGVRLMFDPVVIAVQNEQPFDVVTYRAREDTLAAGRAEYRRLLLRLVDCLETNDWPGVGGGDELTLELPEWARAQDDQPLTIGGIPLEV